MKRVDRIGWTLVVFLAALGLAYGVCGYAWAAAPTLRDNVAAAVSRLGSKRETTVDAREFADAIVDATPSREWAALLVTLAVHESALSARIARGDCLARECDGGKAWGLWQVHKTVRNADSWGSPLLETQARAASHLARGAYNLCRNSGVPFPLSTFRAYAGRGCFAELKGEAARVATYNAVLRRL